MSETNKTDLIIASCVVICTISLILGISFWNREIQVTNRARIEACRAVSNTGADFLICEVARGRL